MGTPTIPDPTTSDPAFLACPRCGYDLTPMVPPPGPARDASATCSECGLEFNWTRLIEARKQLVPHFVEHAKGFRATIAAIPRTFAWLVLPHRFWRRVRIEHAIILRRAVLWLALVAIAPILIEIVAILGLAAFGFATNRQPTPATIRQAIEMINAARSMRHVPGWYQSPPLVLIATALPLCIAAMLLVLPQTRRQAKVRLTHVVRCWIYAHTLAIIVLIWNCLSTLYAMFLTPRVYGWSSNGLPYDIFKYMQDAARSRTHAFPLILAAMLAWQAWYWFTALKIGLRVDRPAAVTASMLTAGTLACLGLLLMLDALPIDMLAW